MSKLAAKTGSNGFPALLPFSFDSAMACVMAAQAGAQACMEWQQELARFAAARLQEDLRVPASLASCRDVGDLVSVQQKWLDTATQDYMTEGERLMRIADRSLRDGVACWSALEPKKAAKEAQAAAASAQIAA